MNSTGASSYGLLSLLNRSADMASFDAITISIASPEKIRSWSYGEVTRPETINYRTLKPEKDGLFCAKIFGPIRDYECLCGKYKRIKYKGVVCEKCGVEVTNSRVRRERMGHIELAAPVCHVWFLRSIPFRISTILGMAQKDVEAIVHFALYVVTDGRMSTLSTGQILTREEYAEALQEHGETSFEVMTGSVAIRSLLEKLDLARIKMKLRKELKDVKSELKRSRIIKRLKLVEGFLESTNSPEWMVLKVIPVIPPELRPLVMMNGGFFAASDSNELYRRLINRTLRMLRLMKLQAPDIVIRNEKRMLQESVDALFDGNKGTGGNVARSGSKRVLKSLSDVLKGKHGRFRQNLLGKRVDYSGRTVIVVGPSLKLHQCGIPKRMALELFKPFVYAKLELYGRSPSMKASKMMVDAELTEVWDVLEEVIAQHPVLLNRAPTLHKLGIQAFDPILVEGKAILLPPLVCRAFNADFDGDQMAVHLPLSLEAQVEARVLMMSTNNILNPQNGKTIILPSQDMVYGLHYLSMEIVTDIEDDKLPIIYNIYEMAYAIQNNELTIHTRILYVYKIKGENDEVVTKFVQTTPGRVYIYEAVPDSCKFKGFEFVNKLFTKKIIASVIDEVCSIAGHQETVNFCDNLLELGFRYSCLSGLSISKDDMIVVGSKESVIDSTMKSVNKLNSQYRDGLITNSERYNKIIDEWNQCTSTISKAVMSAISQERNPYSMNSIYMMANSGARGAEAQIMQICGMRGLMSKPNGEIIETPILSNFKDGLSVLEYFISSHGARKGLVDTALKTANAGYFTRRLVDVTQDCIVCEEDCGSDEGLLIEATVEDGVMISSLVNNIVGRITAGDIINPVTKEIIIGKNKLITSDMLRNIDMKSVSSAVIRSPILCKSRRGICMNCYGISLSTNKMVDIGEAVGIIAAQSIGEPGTQLTMNTKHMSGASLGGVMKSSILSTEQGVIAFKHCSIVVAKDGSELIVGKKAEISILNEKGIVLASYKIPYGSKILCKDGKDVLKGDRLAEWDPYNMPVIVKVDGIIEYHDLIEGASIRERMDDSTCSAIKIVTDWRSASSTSLRPSIILKGDSGEELIEYPMSIGAIITIADNEQVVKGDTIARIPRDSSRDKDITGGLSRVVDLFEARKPSNYSIISEIDGIVNFDKSGKTKRCVTIDPIDDSQKPVKYPVPRGKYVLVEDGDEIKKGDLIVDGHPVPHDTLRVMGLDKFAEYMVREVKKVYEAQGVDINGKHIEVILSMMLKKVEVIDPGETSLLAGEYVDKDVIEDINLKAKRENLRPATELPVLLGITKSSLQTKSFISAAAFQESTKVLTDASIIGKEDRLLSLKENIIVGRLIPAGTGMVVAGVKSMIKSELSSKN